MKKRNVTLTLAACLCVAALTACGTNVTVDVAGGTPESSKSAESSAPVSGSTSAESGVPVADSASTESNFVVETVNPEEQFAISFDYLIDEKSGMEYAVVTGTGDQGTVWTYETSKAEVGQCCSMEYLSSPAGAVYINEGGTVTALNAWDGKVLWQNDSYQGSGSASTVDENNYLYVSGYFDTGIMVIDPNGNTVKTLDCFGEYFWPSLMYFNENGMLEILFECDENAKVIVNTSDYTYTIQ